VRLKIIVVGAVGQEVFQSDAVIDKAIEEYRRHVFLEETNRAYAKLRTDKKASADFDREISDWDATLLDGLESAEPRNEGSPKSAKVKRSRKQ